MDSRLLIDARMSYGRVLYYPACPLSRTLAELSGKKTLSAEELRKLSGAGFEISYKSHIENNSHIENAEKMKSKTPPPAEGESK